MTKNCNVVFDFVSPHNGEYWFKCTYCGATDWFAYYSQPKTRQYSLRDCTNESPKEPTVAGRTLAEWKEFARQDDCLNQMVPSDLRQLLTHIRNF